MVLENGKKRGPNLKLNGDLIKELRLKKGLDQKTAAELSGMKQPNLSDLELGKNRASFRNIKNLAHTLGVEPHTLISKGQ